MQMMSIAPLYEPRTLEMPLETYARIAIDSGIWLFGELLAQELPTKNGFVPDRRFINKPRHSKQPKRLIRTERGFGYVFDACVELEKASAERQRRLRHFLPTGA